MALQRCSECGKEIMACEGPTGPRGPIGPTGETGPPGPGSRVVLSDVLDDSANATIVQLPQAAGDMDDPPLVACYVFDVDSWFVIGGPPGFKILQCMLRPGPNGNVQVEIRTSKPEMYGSAPFRVVAVY